MKRRRSPIQSLKIWFSTHWAIIAIVVALIASIVWPLLTFRTIDSYQRTYLMAILAITPVQSILYSGIFVVMLYWLHYGGGSFSKMQKSRVKGEQIQVTWDEVIGMEETKMEAWEVVELL